MKKEIKAVSEKSECLDQDPLVLSDWTIHSRLFVGTGKYPDFETTERALEASGAEIVTVAIRRVDFNAEDHLLNHVDPGKYKILPNTAGCYNARDAIRIAQISREACGHNKVKLEVLADEKTLLPDPLATLEAAAQLIKEGFYVMAYTSDDPVLAKKLEDIGVPVVMPAGAPIGSGQGILNRNNIRIILERAQVPIVVDAGVGTASDVCQAFELGCVAVLLNTGIAGAKDPIRMARAMKAAAVAGRQAFLSGRIPKKLYATASSPLLDWQ
ncbi:MAG: thiazole synthase [Candidatus Omnitrophica bacterium]|nr:thiazole synthase [bacterium]MBK7495539.1 thiazole synthase [Candidatus Omnitrophota bacterium]MCC6733171.1 thiazole synthase [Candidatus Omnitrophota bacterium]MCL4734062.1 thiazole synthase [Candidatus Omnitrophota bacterium]NUP92897.1 thiazole synthase [Candidatus Omnitrophota bacterium]